MVWFKDLKVEKQSAIYALEYVRPWLDIFVEQGHAITRETYMNPRKRDERTHLILVLWNRRTNLVETSHSSNQDNLNGP